MGGGVGFRFRFFGGWRARFWGNVGGRREEARMVRAVVMELRPIRTFLDMSGGRGAEGRCWAAMGNGGFWILVVGAIGSSTLVLPSTRPPSTLTSTLSLDTGRLSSSSLALFLAARAVFLALFPFDVVGAMYNRLWSPMGESRLHSSSEIRSWSALESMMGLAPEVVSYLQTAQFSV